MGRMEGVLETFFAENGVGFRKGGSSFVLDFCVNPACKKEKHMYCRRSSGRTVCFKCGAKYDWRGLIAQISGCDRNDAFGVLFGGGAGEELSEGDRWDGDVFAATPGQEEAKPDKPMILGLDFPPVDVSPEGLAYLASRNVGAKQILAYDIRWNGSMRAVVFPVKRENSVYGWQARRIAPEEGQLRLISSRFNKSKFLLNWDRASKERALVVVEGPFDCVSADVVDGVGGVATLGKGVSLDQIGLVLSSQAEEIYLGLDPDAYEEIYELAGVIGLRKRVLRARIPAGRGDFGESLPGEVEASFRSAIPMMNPADYLEVHFKS
jgi:hypothetical protein